ncbi:MAG: hypothetical protein QG656_901 [Candidatus Hydrogenedentes bacterium]|nr:hypothetical protein [Candidatus Hydrogenedentota bacterium]
MKKMRYGVGILLALSLVAVPTVSSALTLDESTCTWLTNPSDPYHPGVDQQASGLITLLGLIGTDVPSDWMAWDYEIVGAAEGDGVPDAYQLGILGAILCGSQKASLISTIKSQYYANIAAVNPFIADVNYITTNLPTAVTLLGDILAGLNAATGIHGEVINFPDPGDTVLDMIAEMQGLYDDLSDPLILSALPMVGQALSSLSPWLAGMGGSSTEMQARVDDLLGEIVGFLGDVTNIITPLRALVTAFGPTPGTNVLPVDVCDDLTALADLLASISVTLPVFAVYGDSGKTATEPLSAFGDFNADGTTNLDHYIAVQAASGNREDFVAAATLGVEPTMPVAGLLGLGLIASALAGAGALSLRKRS